MSQYLGQHFLKNTSAIKKIVAVLDIQQRETIIEIGPGKGALTFPLAEECAQKKCRLIAIEKDHSLAQDLESKIMLSSYSLCHSKLDLESRNLDPRVKPEDDNYIQIITGDALKELPELVSKLKIVNYKLVGNIPYYITGKLLRTISELKNKPPHLLYRCGGKPKLSVLMVQKEVAERICATPPKMNLLAAATQYWTNPKIILNLKAKEFDPPPEVDSAVIKLKSKIQNLEPKIAKKYYKLIHVIFKQPRKTLLNNLKEGTHVPKEELETMIKSLDLPLNCRPQNLTIEKILKLTKLIN